LRFAGIGKNRKDASKQRVRANMRLRLNAFCSRGRADAPFSRHSAHSIPHPTEDLPCATLHIRRGRRHAADNSVATGRPGGASRVQL